MWKIAIFTHHLRLTETFVYVKPIRCNIRV